MPLSTEKQLEAYFTYHAPTTVQLEKINAIREGAKAYAKILMSNTPSGADQSAALRLIRESSMTGNAAVVLEGKL